MQATIKGFVYYVKYDFANQPMLKWSETDKMGEHCADWVLVGPHEFEITCPDDFDPRPAQVAAIDAAIASVRAEFTARITELQEQRNKLLALENAS